MRNIIEDLKREVKAYALTVDNKNLVIARLKARIKKLKK